MYAAGEVFITESYAGTTCPGTVITYTCRALSTNMLQWTVTLPSGQININTFTRFGNQLGSTQVFQLIGEDDIVLTLTDLGVNSMSSTLSTSLSRELDQAEVMCSAIDENFITSASKIAIITVTGE